MQYRLFVVSLTAFAALTIGGNAGARDYNINYPDAPLPSADTLVPPPQECIYFPMRSDGQATVIDLDVTVNLTDALNRQRFNPAWNGEQWGPFRTWDVGERGMRLMSTYNEYDRFGMCDHFNWLHKFFERWSGYGPP